MGKHRLSSADDEGFLRAFTDLWTDVELLSDVRVSARVERTNRKGVILLVLTARHVGREGDHWPPAASYSREYPSALVQGLAAAWYASLVQLDRLLSGVASPADREG